MNFYNPTHKNYIASHKGIVQDEIVLELKYDMEHDKESRNLTQQLKTRYLKTLNMFEVVEMVY